MHGNEILFTWAIAISIFLLFPYIQDLYQILEIREISNNCKSVNTNELQIPKLNFLELVTPKAKIFMQEKLTAS